MARRKRKMKKRFKLLFTLILLLIVAAVALFIGMYAYGYKNVIPDRSDSAYEYRDDRINVLVVGTDGGAASENDTGRADSIMVFNVDLKNQVVSALSIPRDSRVSVPGRDSKTKINHSYAYGGIDLTIETVENLLEIPIDYYAVTNFAGFEEIVDLLGGVDLNVETSMHTHTYYGDIDLEPGYQHLDSQQALGYVRYRYDSGGDLARAGRQQQFFKAVFEAAIAPGNLAKLPTLIGQILEVVETDFNSSQLLYLAMTFRDIDFATDMYTTIPECAPRTIGGASYIILDEDDLAATVQELFFDEYDPEFWTARAAEEAE